MHSFSGLLQCFNCQAGFVNGSRSEFTYKKDNDPDR